MSDEAGAAPAAAEQTSVSPAQPEQVTPPNPIESQGPQPEPKADAKPEKAASIKDALAKADAKLKAEPTKSKTEANPEPKADQKEVKSDGPVRDESGKFASKEPKAQQPAQAQEAKQTKETTFREAPQRFSPDAKAAWENSPEPVKAEIHRAVRELESGINEYKQKYEPIKQYDDLARQYGTTVKDALDRYTTLERELNGTPQEKFAALQKVFDYAGVNMREFAAQLAGQQPDQMGVHYEAQMRELRGENAELKERLSAYEQKEQDATMQSVEEFAGKHPRFDELSPTIAKFLETGFAENLDEAYVMADRLKPAAANVSPETPVIPATAAPQPREQKSIAGAPTPGSSPGQRKPSSSIKEALQRAAAAAG